MQCTNRETEDTTCYEVCGGPRHLAPTDGMVQFVHHEGNCLVGNTTDLKLYSALCNVSDRNQLFAFTGGHNSPGFLKMNPERELM